MALFDFIKANLKRLRKKVGATQQQIADVLGVQVRQYQHIEQTGKLTLENAQILANYFGVKISELLGEKEDVTILPDGTLLKGVMPLINVPVVNRIPAGGFTESLATDEIDGYVTTSLKNAEKYKSLFALVANGDSMARRIEHGDTVICTSDHLPFEDGGTYAVINGGSEATLKNVKKVEGGFLLIPENPAYEAKFIAESEMERLYKVLQIVKTL